MVSKRILNVALPLTLGCAALVGTSARADALGTGDAREQIIQALHGSEHLLAQGADAAAFVHQLYSPDIVILGGGERAVRGIPAAISAVQGWLDSMGPGGAKTCRYTIKTPILATDTVFSSFVVVSCRANPPTLLKDVYFAEMYGWKKTSDGWKVVLLMYQPGKF